MTKPSGRIKSSSVPSKAVGSKVSAAAISRLTSDIKRLMTTALDGGKLMGEILSRQFIESNPILAMMYTFTYIYYSANTYEIRQKTDSFTEKYKDLCKLSAGELFCTVPPADERSGKETARGIIKSSVKTYLQTGNKAPQAVTASPPLRKTAFTTAAASPLTVRRTFLTATESPPPRKKPFLMTTASPPSREMAFLTFKTPSPPPLRTILKLSISF